MTLCQILLVAVSFLILSSWACSLEQYQNGCKIEAGSCLCGYGCKTEYIYRTRRLCHNSLKAHHAPATPPAERSFNVCSTQPCARGHCIQMNDVRFTCKCEGTGYYGQRCEKACPTTPVRGMVFPHECIVI